MGTRLGPRLVDDPEASDATDAARRGARSGESAGEDVTTREALRENLHKQFLARDRPLDAVEAGIPTGADDGTQPSGERLACGPAARTV